MKRNLNDKIIFGVCSGIAKSLGIDVTIIRVAFVVCTLLGIGFPVLIYLILAICMQPE